MPVRIVEIAHDDERGMARQIAFEATVGTPRCATPGARIVTIEAAAATRMLLAERGDGEVVASLTAQVMPQIGDDVLQMNGFAVTACQDALGELLDEVEAWGRQRPAGLRASIVHASDPTQHELDAWTALGFEPVGERARLGRAVTPADRDLEPVLPDGWAIVALAEHPELEEPAAALWFAAHRDIPSVLEFDPDERLTLRGDLGLAESDALPASIFVAVDADGGVAGVAYLDQRAVEGPVRVGGHRFTGVDPRWRGCGVARALKVATIRWAADEGMGELVTSNDEHNVAMRALNDSLGYRPKFRLLLLRRDVV